MRTAHGPTTGRMDRARSAPLSRVIVLRWDLDKTYLVTNFESLRSMLWIPFEKAEDKRTVPGVVALIHALRGSAQRRGHKVSIYFLTASPPQIRRAIQDKLKLDGIEFDGITFKNQARHLLRGQIEALREQMGYKLSELLRGGCANASGSRELLFGDDWDSDPFIYSLYADIVAGRIERGRVRRLLERAGVDSIYVEDVDQQLATPLPQYEVAGLFILRQRKRSAEELACFGPRVHFFDNYLECALLLFASGLIGRGAVVDVCQKGGFTSEEATGAYKFAAERVGAPNLDAARGALLAERLMLPVPRGNLLKVVVARLRRALLRGGAPLKSHTFVPDYERLLEDWSHRGRREREREASAS